MTKWVWACQWKWPNVDKRFLTLYIYGHTRGPLSIWSLSRTIDKVSTEMQEQTRVIASASLRIHMTALIQPSQDSQQHKNKHHAQYNIRSLNHIIGDEEASVGRLKAKRMGCDVVPALAVDPFPWVPYHTERSLVPRTFEIAARSERTLHQAFAIEVHTEKRALGWHVLES